MEVPSFLKDSPHLPLMASTISGEAIALCNAFYQTALNADDFKLTQAYVNSFGQFSLELIPVDSDEVWVTFTNQTAKLVSVDIAQTLSEDARSVDWNNLGSLYDSGSYTAFLDAPVVLHSATELGFLDELSNGGSAPTDRPTGVPYKLAELLNAYQFLPTWQSGTLSRKTTGGFKLVYKGDSANCPSEFQVEESDMLAIVEITHGQQLGFVCLRT